MNTINFGNTKLLPFLMVLTGIGFLLYDLIQAIVFVGKASIYAGGRTSFYPEYESLFAEIGLIVIIFGMIIGLILLTSKNPKNTK